jgi:hypothetical protein
MEKEKEDDEEPESDLEEDLEEENLEQTNPQPSFTSSFKPEQINPFLETEPITNLERDIQETPSNEEKNEYKETQLNYLESNTSYSADSTGYVATLNPQQNTSNIPGFQSELSRTSSTQSQGKNEGYTPNAPQREEKKGGTPLSRNRDFR